MHPKRVIKQVLSNGLTILIKESHQIPKVSTQLWYNVGSKDEKSGEKGIAHLIEHMIFKGTKKLSECDINLITHKLSGYTNAFTSFDYTGYLFDFPSQNWQEALPIMADCMHNCTFKEAHLASELKAVIQELKMYLDDYTSSLIEALLASIFPDHPYHHPIIGYKQDLWALRRDALVKFYQHHYIPNNATLVIVGDVNPDQAFARAEKEFGSIKPHFPYKKEEFYHSPDLRKTSVTLYREVQVPHYIISWVIPGSKTAQDYLIDIVSWITASGKGSRLYRKIVDELQLATDLEAFNYDLFEHGLFFIYFQPKDLSVVPTIIDCINEELLKLAQQEVSPGEMTRAIKLAEVEHLGLLENNQKQAYAMGKYYLATGNEEYLYTFTEQPKEHLPAHVKEFVGTFLRPSLMHVGSVLPLQERDKAYFVKLQEISDYEDSVILNRRIREEGIEEGSCVVGIEANPPQPFTFPRAQTIHLENGLKVLSYNNSALPKIDIIIDFLAKQTYDPQGKEGLSYFVASMLLEGTKNYTAEAFADTVESYGMSIETTSGMITLSLLASDLAKGLELLQEILVHALFDPRSIEKVRAQILAELQEFWDTPMQFAVQLARQEVYKHHPYSKPVLGTPEGIKAIGREDLVEFYTNYFSPRGARLAIVGDIERYELKKIFEHMLASWQGPAVSPLSYPPITPVEKREIVYSIMRDQTVLCYAGLSTTRMSPDFDALLLFDQIFSGGALGSMASRLFDLREQSGLFYTIGGSIVSRVDEQPGLILIKTLVSNDRLEEAEKAIERVISTAADEVFDDEFSTAQQLIINGLVDNFQSNYHTAATLLFKDRFELPADYYDTRAQTILKMTKQEMQAVAKRYLNAERCILVRVGRVADR